MEKKDEILRLFSLKIRMILSKLPLEYELLQEMRLRAGKPLFIRYNNREYFVEEMGGLKQKTDKPYIVNECEIREIMEYISNYSLYAFEEEIRQGFITVRGGHRVGVAGKVVLEQEKIKTIKQIHFLNIRFAYERKGCADKVIEYLIEYSDKEIKYSNEKMEYSNKKDISNKQKDIKNEQVKIKEETIYHTLIISPPGCGKTTLLRDLIRQLSNGTSKRKGMTIGVVDERSEIGASYMGIPQNDLGIRTDVLDCCPKAEGMMMLIRSMAPDVIAVDEIGSNDDVEAIEKAVYCGCRLIGTVHGSSIEELMEKPILKKLLEKQIFKRFIVLENKGQVGTVKGIYNEKGVSLV